MINVAVPKVLGRGGMALGEARNCSSTESDLSGCCWQWWWRGTGCAPALHKQVMYSIRTARRVAQDQAERLALQCPSLFFELWPSVK